MTVTHHVGPALELMAAMPDGSVDAVIGSPPFLALRDYAGMPGQWGSEPDPASFLANLLALTLEARRVLAPHGSLVVELGDTYSGSGGGGGDYLPGGMRDGQNAFDGSARAANAAHWRAKQVAKAQWPLPKSLCLIPTLFPACLAYGRNLLDPDAEPFEPWRVRNLIVWARNNPPVGALGDKVRPATSYITVACTSERRWFDLDAVRTVNHPERIHEQNYNRASDQGLAPTFGGKVADGHQNPAGAPPLDHWWDEPDGDLVWLINTQGSSLSHYAMWPPKLAERLVLSMVPAEVCRVCSEPRRRLVERTPEYAAIRERVGDFNRNRKAGVADAVAGLSSNNRAADMGKLTSAEHVTLGWSDCGHGDYRPGVVLDPFAGTGTTLAVADIHGRDAIGFDLDPANAGLYPQRYEQCWRALGRKTASPITPHGEQLGLL